jgi:hypothetical protein
MSTMAASACLIVLFGLRPGLRFAAFAGREALRHAVFRTAFAELFVLRADFAAVFRFTAMSSPIPP